MSGSPLFAIVIPCFQKARFLPEALESVLAQRFERWELVVVDDGSPDETSGIAERWARAHPERAIRWLRQDHAGVSSARNAGIAATTAPLIVPLEADDALARDYLASVAAAFETSSETNLVFTDIAFFGSSSGPGRLSGFEPEALRRGNTLPKTSAFTRDLWRLAGGYAVELREGYEDWDFWLACSEVGLQAVHVPKTLFRHRIKAEELEALSLERDARLKAQLIRRHPRLFNELQRSWAEVVLVSASESRPLPAPECYFFAPFGRMPNEGEALADLGALAWNPGAPDAAARHWLAALRSGDLPYASRTRLFSVVESLALTGKLVRLAEDEDS
jgi:glycosyltransferase involved in cell wall biosynthesis